MSDTQDPVVTSGSYSGWDAWRIENGPLALILVPQVGGRIMGLQWHGQELSFVNSACEGRIEPLHSITDLHADGVGGGVRSGPNDP